MQAELMVFGILSLLMGHWIIFVSKVCVKSSVLSRDFYLCAAENGIKRPSFENHLVISNRESRNTSFSSEKNEHNREGFCPEVWLFFIAVITFSFFSKLCNFDKLIKLGICFPFVMIKKSVQTI